MKIEFPTEHLSCVDLHTYAAAVQDTEDSSYKEESLVFPYELLLDKLSSLGDYLDYPKTPPIMCRRQAHKLQNANSLRDR